MSELLRGGAGGGGFRPQDVGVVTPYSAQVRMLRNHMRQAGIPTAAGGFTRVQNEGAPSTVQNEVEVASVDGFQGREKEVIVICTVRANFNHR